MTIQVFYKGSHIYYDEEKNTWESPHFNLTIEGCDGLKVIKDEIDALIKDTDVNVIYIGRGPTRSEAISGTVSVNKSKGYIRKPLVFKYDGNKYIHVNYLDLVLDTPENRATLDSLSDNLDKRAKLSLEYTRISDQLQKTSAPLVISALKGTEK